MRLCDVESPDPTGAFVDLPGHTGSKAGFLCLAASPDGHDLAGAGTDGVVRIWPIAERTLLAAPASP